MAGSGREWQGVAGIDGQYDSDRWPCYHESKRSAPLKKEKAKSNGINPSSFYKSNICNDERLTAILRLAAHNEVVWKRCEFTSTQKKQRDAYREVTKFQIFPLQVMAFDFFTEMKEERLLSKEKHISRFHADNIQHGTEEYGSLPELWSMEPRIFAVETSSGKRKYIVGNLGRFMQHYWRETDPRSRHFYELIPEGTPCRLYFDLEFAKAINRITPDESEILMTDFIDELCSEFQIVHDICLSRSCIVDLDSSTEKKFSRHLIVHLPNCELFADAFSAGLFVKRFVGRLAEEVSTGALERRRATLAKHLFVKRAPKSVEPELLKSENIAERDTDASSKHLFDNKELTCFVDLGVYTRNRLFRLMGSTKFGHEPSAALRISSANMFCFPAGFDNSKFYLPLRATNVSPSSFASSETSNSNRDRDHAAFCASLDWEIHARALGLTLVVPTDINKTNSSILMEPDNRCRDLVEPKDSFIASRHKLPCPTCYGASPIQTLDNFILQLSTRGGIQGRIRAWSLEDGQLSYQMSDNRWCENIGRAHKSNNVIWNVNLKCRTYWQTCYDTECRATNFRGTANHLPADVASDVSDYLIDQELAAIDVDQIIHEARNGSGGSEFRKHLALDSTGK
jgi:hypothetical protein